VYKTTRQNATSTNLVTRNKTKGAKRKEEDGEGNEEIGRKKRAAHEPNM